MFIRTGQAMVARENKFGQPQHLKLDSGGGNRKGVLMLGDGGFNAAQGDFYSMSNDVLVAVHPASSFGQSGIGYLVDYQLGARHPFTISHQGHVGVGLTQAREEFGWSIDDDVDVELQNAGMSVAWGNVGSGMTYAIWAVMNSFLNPAIVQPEAAAVLAEAQADGSGSITDLSGVLVDVYDNSPSKQRVTNAYGVNIRTEVFTAGTAKRIGLRVGKPAGPGSPLELSGLFEGAVEFDDPLYFGSGRDANLYRSGADELSSDDRLRLVNGDFVAASSARGLVLKDTQATPHYWRVTVNNSGQLVTTDLGASLPAAP